MDRSGFRHTPSPVSPSAGGTTPIETKGQPTQVKPLSSGATPLASKLQAWEKHSDRPAPAQVVRGEAGAQGTAQAGSPPGPRRLNVEGEAEVRDPRIVHLADHADLSDDEDTDVRMPPARVDGKSPDTSFAVRDPAWDAVWTAMTFNGASLGMSLQECNSLLRQPDVQGGLLGAMARGLEDWGYPAGTPVPDPVMAKLADQVTRLVLEHLRTGQDESTPPPPDDDAPSFEELEARLAALAAQASADSAGTPTTPYLGPTPLARKPEGKG